MRLNRDHNPEKLQQEQPLAESEEQAEAQVAPEQPEFPEDSEGELTPPARDPAEQRIEARRHKKQRTVFEMIWDFFASVRVAIVIIIAIAVSSILGTLYPQENAIPSRNPDMYYMDAYGKLGDVYHKLGLSDMYNSWWYMTLILMLAISLIVCSIERVVPLYKSLKYQPVARKLISMRTDRLFTKKEISSEADMDALAAALKKKRFKIRRENGALLAEKGRFPRFGAYILHIGLLIIIAGVFSRLIPGWYYSDMVWLKAGERQQIPKLSFALQNNGFTLDFYDAARTRAKKYETDVAVYQGNQEVVAKHLIVNDPLLFDHTYIYQNSFDPTPMFQKGKVEMIEKKSGKSLGTFDINFDNPQQVYKVGDYTLKMVNYYPDIRVDPQKGVYTNSRDPYNPGLQFDITGPGLTEASREWMIPMAPFIEQMLGKSYPITLKFKDVSLFNMTGLKLEKDLGIPIVYVGIAIVLYGLVLCFYFQHRRVWARLEDGVMYVSANTNKNWIGMSREFNKAVEPIGFEPAIMKTRIKKSKKPNYQAAPVTGEGTVG